MWKLNNIPIEAGSIKDAIKQGKEFIHTNNLESCTILSPSGWVVKIERL